MPDARTRRYVGSIAPNSPGHDPFTRTTSHTREHQCQTSTQDAALLSDHDSDEISAGEQPLRCQHSGVGNTHATLLTHTAFLQLSADRTPHPPPNPAKHTHGPETDPHAPCESQQYGYNADSAAGGTLTPTTRHAYLPLRSISTSDHRVATAMLFPEEIGRAHV